MLKRHKHFLLLSLIALCLLSAPHHADATSLYSHTGAGGECCTLDGASGTNEAYSQTFTTALDYQLTTADIWLSTQGSPVDGATMSIYADSGGFPTGSALFVSAVGSGWSGGSLNFQTVAFTSACLPAGTYDFVLSRTGTRDGTNDYVTGRTAGSGMGVSNSGVWSTSGA